jgi:hypothetical protein
MRLWVRMMFPPCIHMQTASLALPNGGAEGF